MGGLFGGGKVKAPVAPKIDTSAQDKMIAQTQQQIDTQQKETERLRTQAEEERRTMEEQLAAKQSARRRGGKRSLLSEARFMPELGIMDEEEKLGG